MTQQKSHVLRKLAFMSLVIVYLFWAASVVVAQEQNSIRIIENRNKLAAKDAKPKMGRIIMVDGSPKQSSQKQSSQKQSSQKQFSQTSKQSSKPNAGNSKTNQPRGMTQVDSTAQNSTKLPVIEKIDFSKFKNVPESSIKTHPVPVTKPNGGEQEQLMKRMVQKQQVTASQVRAQKARDSQVKPIAELPIQNPNASQPPVNPTGFYPATSNQLPVGNELAEQNRKTVSTNQNTNIQNQPVQTGPQNVPVPNPGPFANRSEYNMLRPVMPRPANSNQDKVQERRIDPRREQILSSGEYLHDGGDRNLKTVVGGDWSVKGLDTEDTIGHFDTLKGDRVVVPSNRVSIYAPRFAAVRQEDGIISADGVERMAKTSDTSMIFRSNGSDFATTTKQHVAAEKNVGSKSASALIDRTKGIVVDNTTGTKTVFNHIGPRKIHNFVMTGLLSNAEKPFIAAAVTFAKTWSNNQEVQAVVKNENVGIVHDVKSANDVTHYEAKGKKSQLRVIKMASKRSAQPGEIVEFTIRFDNVGSELIGNVTLIDNLTPRLEYIPGSSNCSVQADLITKQNEAGSVTLRWEVIKPLKIGTGGVIRFKCRVR